MYLQLVLLLVWKICTKNLLDVRTYIMHAKYIRMRILHGLLIPERLDIFVERVYNAAQEVGQPLVSER